MIPDTLTPDLCVIGAGAAGLSVAAAAAGLGVPVVLIEKGRMGGDCLNTGCVPSKALLAAARRAAQLRNGAVFGIGPNVPQVDFARVTAHLREVIDGIAPIDSVARFAGLGVQVIEGTARFIDPLTVTVGEVRIRPRRFVIATGSRPAVPSIPGLGDVPFLTNETVFDLDALPQHLVVLGAGPIGLELAQAFRRLGARVTVLEAATPLARDDPEAAAVVLDQLNREGVDLRLGARAVGVAQNYDRIVVALDGGAGETVTGSHLLVATGRVPNIEALDLKAAGIEMNARGIAVDARLRTSNRRVFAIGDVAGGAQFTHAANYHAGIVIRNALFRLPAKADADAIPWVTYTDPELAQTGLTEAEARRRNHAINVLRWPYHENDRAQAERRTHGHIKIVTTRRGRILGATIVGAEAGELITAWTLAIGQRLNIRAMTGLVVPYPTLAEIGKRAAISHFAPRLTSPVVRRIIAWLRRLG